MSYLQDKRIKNKKTIIGLVIAVVLFLIIVFSSALSGFSFFSHSFTRPIWIGGNSLRNYISHLSVIFDSKKSLLKENESLKQQIEEGNIKIFDRNILAEENDKLKEILNRKVSSNLVLGVILTKPNKSLYDTFVIDIGESSGILKGERVFAYGNVLIGEISEVYKNSSVVKMYSSPGEKIPVLVKGKDLYVDAIGLGGGNFEIDILHEIQLEKGTEVVAPSLSLYIIGTVEEVISDPRDPSQKILLKSPVNIQELKFVEVLK
ncbi:MAG: rod shape-determining protein MreC [Candidatus Paceibacterota bacterium]|jgi:cell shape-determining protein MreC